MKLAKIICKILQDEGYQAVLAGGCVRDKILGVEYNDIDIATNAKPDQSFPILIKNGFSVKIVGESFAVILAKKFGNEYEIASFRKDIDCDGRHPEKIEYATMEEDANRRDFTMNAVFFDPISEEYFDFVNGIDDIESKTIRFVGNPIDRIKEDYLRILRYFRFKIRGFHSTLTDIEALKNLKEDITDFIAPERITKELIEKVCSKNQMYDFLKEMIKYPKIFKSIFPEVFDLIGVQQNPEFHPEGDSYIHTIQVVQQLDIMKADYECVFAGLFHDIGKKSTTILESDGKLHSKGHEKVSYELTKDILSRMKFSKDDIYHISGIVLNHMKLHYIGMKKATFRKLMAEPFFNDLVIHSKADCLGSNGDLSEYNHYVELIKTTDAIQERKLPKPFIDGSVLIELGLKPSPLFKTILNNLMDMQLEGVVNSKEEGLDKVMKILGIA